MKPKRHPVVQSFFNRNTIKEYFDACARAQDPCSRALNGFHRTSAGTMEPAEALALGEAARSGEVKDLELLVLTLATWQLFSCVHGRLDEAQALCNQMHGLIDRQSPVELRAMLLDAEGLLASIRGNKDARLRLLHQALSLLPKESRYYGRSAAVIAGFTAQLGRGVEAEELIESLDDFGAECKEIGILLHVAQLITYAEAAQPAKTEQHYEKLQECGLENAPPSVVRNIEAYVFLARWAREQQELETIIRKPGPTAECAGQGPPDFLQVADALMGGDPLAALAQARAYAKDNPRHALISLGFNTFNLLRAELSNRNWEAGLRLLELRHQHGNTHFLDDFFLARIKLLAGNLSDAREHFRRLRRSVKRYQWENRLELEIRMAPELTGTNVYRLLEGSSLDSGDGPIRPATVREERGVARLIGNSPQLAAVRRQIARFAPADAQVLICGPTGTGKELVAQALHEDSPRSDQPFLAVNCGAIAEGLLETELFGYEKGSFTGAQRGKRGLFEAAGNGTIFLDEIGEIPPRLQVLLLRVLEAREIRPVGATRSRKIKCRILAATNADLEAKVADGTFRRDLFYRLKRLEVSIPPLSERIEDIAPLADYYLQLGRTDGQRPVMSREFLEALEARPWPGNVRELRNTIEVLRLVTSDKLRYEPADLQSESPPDTANSGAEMAPESLSVEKILAGGKSSLRRLDRLRALFLKHRKLTRLEVISILGVSPPTATKDLKQLRQEGIIEKVKPNTSPRTHYFRLRESTPAR